ncbi:MAG: DEAD/DEAH box helicase [Spirulina sp.]
MATLIPAYSAVSGRMTNGEKRLAERLEEKLEDDYLLWYDVPVGKKRLHPDFIILHPLRGLIVLEVKDWSLDNIKQFNPDSFTVVMGDGERPCKNPLEQARDYALAIANQLQRDKQLTQAAGPHRGKLAFPYSYGVVFTNIKRKDLDKAYFFEPMLEEILPSTLVICQDEMLPSTDPLAFQEQLWNLATYQFGETLTPAQIDRIRWHIFPEIRINDSLSGPATSDEDITIPDILRVMDLQQEQLARSLGDGHRVIHGVAGSGKTMILAYRCIHLAETIDKPILVLCYNVALAAMLRQKLHAEGVGHRVTIRNIHKWCSDLLKLYQIPRPSSNQFKGDAYYDEIIRRVLNAVTSGRIPAGQFGAVMIDEGHDFKSEWYQLVVQMVDPDTDSLLVLYDDAQSIYEKQQRQSFSFKSVGVKAQGRTKILHINYRNTQEILTIAYEFAKELLTPTEGKDDDTPVLVQPETAGRHGPPPRLIKLPSFRHEVDYLTQQVQAFHNQGTPWNDIGIIYRTKFMAEEVSKHFQREGIPVEWINRDKASRDYSTTQDSIKLVTMHSSKGLEFPIVCIPGLGFMPNRYGEPDDEARLLYVAMTRAMEQLVMTCDRQSTFVDRLEGMLEKA